MADRRDRKGDEARRKKAKHGLTGEYEKYGEEGQLFKRTTAPRMHYIHPPGVT